MPLAVGRRALFVGGFAPKPPAGFAGLLLWGVSLWALLLPFARSFASLVACCARRFPSAPSLVARRSSSSRSPSLAPSRCWPRRSPSPAGRRCRSAWSCPGAARGGRGSWSSPRRPRRCRSRCARLCLVARGVSSWVLFRFARFGRRVGRFGPGGRRWVCACPPAFPCGRSLAGAVAALARGWSSRLRAGGWSSSVGPLPSFPAVLACRFGRRPGRGSAGSPVRLCARGCSMGALPSVCVGCVVASGCAGACAAACARRRAAAAAWRSFRAGGPPSGPVAAALSWRAWFAARAAGPALASSPCAVGQLPLF